MLFGQAQHTGAHGNVEGGVMNPGLVQLLNSLGGRNQHVQIALLREVAELMKILVRLAIGVEGRARIVDQTASGSELAKP